MAGFFKKLPFKPEEKLITSGVINMRNLLRPLFSTLIVLSVSAPAFAATPITLENSQSETKVETKSETKVEPKRELTPDAKLVTKLPEKKVITKKEKPKKVAKAAVKSRFETLSNGQKVKVFSGAITEMPKEVGVQYVTEAGYQKLLKELKEDKKGIKPVATTPVKMETVVLPAKKEIDPVKEVVVPATPITVAAPVQKPIKQPTPAAQAIVPEPATPITLQPVAQDPVVEVKAVDVSALPPAPTPVKAQEVADPIPMIQQHPAPVVQAAPAVVTPVAPIAAIPIVVAPVMDDKKTVVNANNIPKVTISVEQRAEMKKQLAEEFNNISIKDTNVNLSQKVLEEQQKVEDTIAAKTKAEADAKAKTEEAAKAVQAAKDEKEYRENAPLAEDNNATPAKAYTEEELKPVRLDKKNKNIVIELPKQRLNAYLTGAPMPKVDDLEQQQLDDQRRGQRLEENSEMEEVSGPNYNNINN